MNWKGSFGIDIGLEAKHVASVLGVNGMPLQAKTVKFSSDPDELEALVSRYAPDIETRKDITVSMEPTGNAWVLLSAFFRVKGFRVFLVKTQKSYDLRRFIKRHTKTDSLDAKALAKLPFIFPEDMNEYVPPSKESSALERLVKSRETIVSKTSGYKNRVYSHFQLLNPFVLQEFGTNRFTQLAKAFYSRYANPLKAVEIGRKRFCAYLAKHGYGSPSPELLDSLYNACEKAARLHKINTDENGQRHYDLEIQAELVQNDLDIIAFFEKKVKKLEEEIGVFYKKVDPQMVLKNMKGFGGEIVAPGVIALSGPFPRFSKINNYLGLIGLVPKTSQSSTSNKEGMKITKAGKKLLKKYYCIAAETARQWDVEVAACYHRHINNGLHHNQAICAVANMLARRVYAVMKRRDEALARNDTKALGKIGYELRDLKGNPITSQQAREIILRDYPSKKVQKERAIMKKEKAA